MKRFLVLVTLCLALAASGEEKPADLVLTGAAVYTLDAARSWAEAVAVKDGRIVYVGSAAGAPVGEGTEVLHLPGRMVLPGFQDAHIHPAMSAVELRQCGLHELTGPDAILEKIRACARALPAEGWVVGSGWELPSFPGGAPTKELLDEAVGERPAYMLAADGHSAWVSSKALELAGITAATPDPANGRIERDPKTGAPAGTLREAATDLVSKLLPVPDIEERLAAWLPVQEMLLRFGVTAFQDASVREQELQTYRESERRGELHTRVVAALVTDPERGPEQVDDLLRLRRKYTSDRIRPTAAKIFADGVIEARTAAMLAPYTGHPGERGEPVLPQEKLDALVARLAEAGFSVHVHAIGDRAVRMTLDAFEAAGRSADPPDRLRHQIAHLEVIDPADVPRFRALGVIANFQPLWAYADTYVTELTWPVLGPERSRWLYPMGSVHRSGGPLAFGSDWSVSSPNPLEGIQVAVTRQALDMSTPPMMPEERLDLPTALAAYTIGAAYANGLERETGSIEVGKKADLIVLSANLFDVAPSDLAHTEVLLTLLGGREVYRNPSWSGP